jgi:hypothetical protein
MTQQLVMWCQHGYYLVVRCQYGYWIVLRSGPGDGTQREPTRSKDRNEFV